MSYIDQTRADIQNSNYTNLYLAEILISDYIANHNNYIGLTRNEISARWRNNPRYRKQFYPSYCQRKLEQSGSILILIDDRYKINESNERLTTLLDENLLNDISTAIDRPNPVISNIERFRSIEDKQEFFSSIRYLLVNGSPNDFEVLSFAVLYAHLEIFGFSLKRFTSTNAADGGVDFIGGDIIYCVTTNLTSNKLESDIVKTHAKKIFIHRNIIGTKLKNMIHDYISEGKISDVIHVEQIIERYLNFLEEKDDVFQITTRLKALIINEYGKEIL